ncbi:hypothetical protein M4578_12615 [Salipiger sp. P9]|uniref:hypothetical protein n=1 Tax=Salipiger pentaromativorans TaxID=2943193 RepID=UPI0021578D36|nr:hypothetical protein [Salipiger pentaromativorans]MCR8548674.1 hypothetical protein [Salipiger pentaromativorans]
MNPLYDYVITIALALSAAGFSDAEIAKALVDDEVFGAVPLDTMAGALADPASLGGVDAARLTALLTAAGRYDDADIAAEVARLAGALRKAGGGGFLPFQKRQYPMVPIPSDPPSVWAQSLFDLETWVTDNKIDAATGGIVSYSEGSLYTVLAKGPAERFTKIMYVAVIGDGAPDVLPGVYPPPIPGQNTTFTPWTGAAFSAGDVVPEGQVYWWRAEIDWSAVRPGENAVFFAKSEKSGNSKPFALQCYKGL